MSIHYMIRANETEGYMDARKYRAAESAAAYAELATLSAKGTVMTYDELTVLRTKLGIDLDPVMGYPTSEDSTYTARHSRRLTGMACFITCARFRMGNGFKVLRVVGK